MGVLITLRRDTTANWTAGNPVLQLGEPGWDITLKKMKIGDGVTPWTLLPFFNVSLTPASETVSGILELATLAEVDAGTDDARAITPSKAKRSTLFPFKGAWIQPTVDEAGYAINNVVTYDHKIYNSLTANNKTIPGDDPLTWDLLGGGGDDPALSEAYTWYSFDATDQDEFASINIPWTSDKILLHGPHPVVAQALQTFSGEWSQTVWQMGYDAFPTVTSLRISGFDNSDPTALIMIAILNKAVVVEGVAQPMSTEDPTTTAYADSAALNTEYPGVPVSYEVVCKDVTDGPRIYKKVSASEWQILMLQFI